MRRLVGVVMGLCMMATGCVRTLPGQDPPSTTRFYYPNRMALAPDNSSLYIVNTNFDERYNVGWMTRVDLTTLLPNLAAAQAQNQVLDAAAAGPSLSQGARVPSLGGDVVLDTAHSRAYLAHRGQGLITTFDLMPDAQGQMQMTCGDVALPGAREGLTHIEQQTSCDRQHLFDVARVMQNYDPNASVASWADPFALALVQTPQNPYPALVTGFLGASTLVTLQPGAAAQDLALRKSISLNSASLGHLLPIPDPSVLPAGGTLLGTTHFSVEQTARGALYTVDLASLLVDPAVGTDDATRAAALNRYDLGRDLGASLETRADVAGVAFKPGDPTRLYVAHRDPDALIFLRRTALTQSSIDRTGAAQYTQTVTTSVQDTQRMGDGRLSQVAYIARATTGDVVAVLSLAGDMLYLFDVSRDNLQLTGRFAFAKGQGPVDIAHVIDGARHYLFVTTFFDHGLTVLDVSSANSGDIRLVASIHDDTRLAPDAQP